jgi:hypothetical protein
MEIETRELNLTASIPQRMDALQFRRFFVIFTLSQASNSVNHAQDDINSLDFIDL